MYAEYKRDVSHNYLILREEEKVNTASYQVRMLTGNVIPSILKCRLQGLDGNLLFYYDITSRRLFMNSGNFTEKICTCFLADSFV